MEANFLSANSSLHFAWWDIQEVSAGTPGDHDALHFAFLKNGIYPMGSSKKLEHSPQGVYDLAELKDVMKV